MTATADQPDDNPAKGSKKPLLIGMVLAIIGGAGGFIAVGSGMLTQAPKDHVADQHVDDHSSAAPALSFSFVAIDPLIISLPSTRGRDHLRFAAQVDVPPEYVAEVEAIKPRLVDVLNTYLRAVKLAELEDPTALVKLRSQMLRRLQIVAGEGRINDLLIMEFVLN